jgi:hypothetical protein
LDAASSAIAASSTDTVHMTASCGAAGKVGSMNCGRKAVKKAIVLGLVTATRKRRITGDLTPISGRRDMPPA